MTFDNGACNHQSALGEMSRPIHRTVARATSQKNGAIAPTMTAPSMFSIPQA